MSNEGNRWMDEEIDNFFKGQTSIPKEQLKEMIKSRKRGPGRGRGGGKPGMNDELKQKFDEFLENELNKITSNTISKDEAKAFLTSFRSQAKEQWHTLIDEQMKSSIQDEFKKLNVKQLNKNQARDLLRNACHKMHPPGGHHGGSPSVLDDSMKPEFLQEFEKVHGTKNIGKEEVWTLMKAFDKKQHEKMGCCDRNGEWEKEKDQRWEKIFDEEYQSLLGNSNREMNQQDLEQLAQKIKEKLRADCSHHPEKRFRQQ